MSSIIQKKSGGFNNSTNHSVKSRCIATPGEHDWEFGVDDVVRDPLRFGALWQMVLSPVKPYFPWKKRPKRQPSFNTCFPMPDK